jgi:uncharacterized MAPEG superfamily protein
VVVSKPKIADRSNPSHVVVDGSNLATEGRGAPSLKQLNEAVLAFMKEYPKTQVTVVVDASFAHRIDKKEAVEFSEAIANGELVTPPAGALGRGDGFVLMIADKVNATVVSNDSYQEFHDHYPWLFEQGRLIGGKPVPHVGWVFVDRLPVRVKTDAPPRRGVPNKTAPIPRPTSRPPGRPTVKEAAPARPAAAPAPRSSSASARPSSSNKSPQASTSRASAQSAVNSVEQFEAFAAKHAIGARVKGVVESFASHGAYVRIGEVAGYLPVRLMKSPAPRTPREQVKIGDPLTLSVSDFNQSRRSIEVSLMPVEKPAASKAAKPAKRLPVARVLKRRRRRD